MTEKILSDADIEHFLIRGHVVLHDCFSRELAQEWVDNGFQRLGYDKNDPSTWKEKRIHMPGTRRQDVSTFAPKAWAAACQLLGGEDRVGQPTMWSDALIFNLGEGADRPWESPTEKKKGWHKDGDFFRHFLDSPEQGLLTLVLWTDIEPRGGGTFVACDSVAPIARLLAAHPEGVNPGQFDFGSAIGECSDLIELTGRVGDVALLHPYMLHSGSWNHRGTARAITNPPFWLKQPMNFNRDNAEDFSPVERGVLRGLGVERYDFKPTAPREKVVPERIAKQKRMLEEEKARLAATTK